MDQFEFHCPNCGAAVPYHAPALYQCPDCGLWVYSYMLADGEIQRVSVTEMRNT